MPPRPPRPPNPPGPAHGLVARHRAAGNRHVPALDEEAAALSAAARAAAPADATNDGLGVVVGALRRERAAQTAGAADAAIATLSDVAGDRIARQRQAARRQVDRAALGGGSGTAGAAGTSRF